jgi:hypothetical protein
LLLQLLVNFAKRLRLVVPQEDSRWSCRGLGLRGQQLAKGPTPLSSLIDDREDLNCPLSECMRVLSIGPGMGRHHHLAVCLGCSE